MPRQESIVLKRKQQAADSDEGYIANAIRMAELASDKKARDIKVYKVHGLTLIADAFVLCTATSEPQMKAVAASVRTGMKEIGVSPLNSEGSHKGGWMLIDFGDIIVHVFREEPRAFYDLDGLWGDAPEIPLDLDEP